MRNEQTLKEMLRARVDDFWDMILINILFILSCLPLFTIGAATTALSSTVSKISQKRKRSAFGEYFTSFKEYFGRATKLWLLVLTSLMILGFDVIVVSKMEGYFKFISMGLMAFALLMVLCINTTSLLYILRTEASTKELIQLSLNTLAMHPFSVLACVLIMVIPWAFALIAPNAFAALFLVWILIYFSFAQLIVLRIFKEYIFDK